MSLNRKIAHNTIWQFGGKIVGTALAVIAMSQLFRYLGPKGYGKFHIIVTFVQVAGIIVDFGIYLIVLNKISDPKKSDNEVISQSLVFRFYLNLVYLLLMGLLALVLPYESAIKIGIFLMSFSNVFLWFSQILQTVFQKQMRTHYVAIAEVVSRAILLTSTMVMIYFEVSLITLSLTVVLCNLGGFLLSVFFSYKHVDFHWHLKKEFVLNLLKSAWPIAVSIWFSLLYFKADTIILSLFKSNYEVGIYGMPYRILETLITLPLAFMGLMLPLLGDAYNRGHQKRFKKYLQKGFDGLSIMAVPLLFGSWPLAKSIILLFAGREFIESAPILRILMIGVLIIYIGALFAHAIVVISCQRQMIKYYLIIAALMMILYFTLIPIYSYWAAAWLTVVGEGLVFLATLFVIKKQTDFFPQTTVFWKSVFSAIIMAVLLYPLRNLTVFLTIPLGVLFYGAIMYFSGGIRKELWSEILKLG